MQPSPEDYPGSSWEKNPQIFTDLVNKWTPRLLGYCNRLLHDGHAAREVVQGAFISAFTSARFNGAGEKEWSRYIFTIVRNACNKEFQRRSRILEIHGEFDDEVEERADPAAEVPFAHLMEDERARALEVFVASVGLTPLQRMVFDLRYRSEMSYEEIREKLGLSASHVKVIMFRIHEALRAAAREKGLDLDSF